MNKVYVYYKEKYFSLILGIACIAAVTAFALYAEKPEEIFSNVTYYIQIVTFSFIGLCYIYQYLSARNKIYLKLDSTGIVFYGSKKETIGIKEVESVNMNDDLTKITIKTENKNHVIYGKKISDVDIVNIGNYFTNMGIPFK